MKSIKNILKTFKLKLASIEDDFSDELTDLQKEFNKSFSCYDIYKYLFNTYVNKKEISDIYFYNTKHKTTNDDCCKWHGDLDEDFDFDEEYLNDDNSFAYPKFWKFRTDNSKVYKDFVDDIYFFKSMNCFDYEIKEVKSNKEEHGNYEKEWKGTKTKNTTLIEIKTAEDDEDSQYL